MNIRLIPGVSCYNWKRRKLLRKPGIQGSAENILLTLTKVKLPNFEKIEPDWNCSNKLKHEVTQIPVLLSSKTMDVVTRSCTYTVYL